MYEGTENNLETPPYIYYFRYVPYLFLAVLSYSLGYVLLAFQKEDIQKELNHKEEIGMKKVLKIEGMMCNHCTGRVEKALNDLDGVTAEVSLEGKSATVTLSKDVSDETLVQTVTDAGYEVVDIQ